MYAWCAPHSPGLALWRDAASLADAANLVERRMRMVTNTSGKWKLQLTAVCLLALSARVARVDTLAAQERAPQPTIAWFR